MECEQIVAEMDFTEEQQVDAAVVDEYLNDGDVEDILTNL